EHQVTAGGQDRGAHREFVAPAPLLLTVGVESADVADRFLDVDLNSGTPVWNSLFELATAAGGRGPDVLDGYVEELGAWAVGGGRPLLGPSRTGIEVHRDALFIGVDLGRHLAVPGDRPPGDPIHEGRDRDPL